MPLRFKYKGIIPEDDTLHQVTDLPKKGIGPRPGCVHIPGVGCVPQYAPTVVGQNLSYDPANDCEGCFMSYKFQVHNNCYNYAVDIATNSMALPGRKHGVKYKRYIDAHTVAHGAKLDGLKLAGGPRTTIDDLRDLGWEDGHFVALLIASAVPKAGFRGDFHWVRCDDFKSLSWSQKDGPDQVTDFDFAGEPIRDPSCANWTVNSGPLKPKPGSPDFIVKYRFKAWMFVPHCGVDII